MFKKVCNTLGMSRAELAEKLGLSKTTIDSWSDSSRISKTAKVALELMLENHNLRSIIKNFQDGFASLNLYNLGDNTMNNIFSQDNDDLIDRINHIFNELKLSEITCSRAMGESNYVKINQILNFKMYPDFDFLEKFALTFKINHDWLLTGEGSPFANDFIKSNFNSQFIKEAEEFDRIYIVTCKNNLDHTRIIVTNRNNEFGLYQTYFCIGSNFIMEARECSDLCDLYEFYQKFKYKISCLEFNEDDYRKLLSLKHYPKNILDHGQTSYMLFDLFDLREDDKERYGEFFEECINIIKSTLKDRENRRIERN
ncbi:helix-turn-helix transcriptional regulator, partial [Campylobacter coli]|nr:XRE family transcriptional regulator [Campylobacter jejuni]